MKDRYVIEYQAPSGGWYRYPEDYVTEKGAINSIPILRRRWKDLKLIGGRPISYQVMYNGERVHRAGG